MPQQHNDASVQRTNDEWTVSVPGPQWSYAASWARVRAGHKDEPIVVEVELEIREGHIGLAFVGFDGKFVSKEKLARPAGSPQTLTLAAERSSEIDYLVLRNTDPDGATATARVRGVRVFSAVVLPAHLYVIYQAEKTASQTLEASVRASDDDCMVERHHFLAASTIARFERFLARCTEGDPESESYRKQVESARRAAKLLEGYPPDETWILTGFRDPLDRALSAFFQHLQFLCPDLTYAPENIISEGEKVLATFRADFDAFLARRRSCEPSNLRSFLIDRTMQNLDQWLQEELFEAFRLNVYRVKLGSMPFVRLRHRRRNFVLYRVETLRAQLPKILETLPLPADRIVVNRNEGGDKPYAALYQYTRERFRPTTDMVNYYYRDSKFFAHAFRDIAPVYRSTS